MMNQIAAALMKDALIAGNPCIVLEKVELSGVPAMEYAYVRTDSTAVAAIMDNLLSNAIKYSSQGTEITVTVTKPHMATDWPSPRNC